MERAADGVGNQIDCTDIRAGDGTQAFPEFDRVEVSGDRIE